MAANNSYFQPIIRGIQNVGSVQILYRYNSSDYHLPLTDMIKLRTGQDAKGDYIDTTDEGIPIAGFRLDSEFLRANPQIASSFVIPILGGGGVALTNNNRTGTLNLVCARVSAPTQDTSAAIGSMIKENGQGIGVSGQFENEQADYYDFVTIAQIQQAQPGGDSVGARIRIKFSFCGVLTTLTFEGCTIATVDPIGLAGNDAVNYSIAVNYLNWKLEFSK